MRRLTILIAVISGAIALGACSSSGAVLETVPPQDAAELLATEPDVVVLDIRTPEEYSAGALAGAINLDFYDPGFPSALESLDPDIHYVVYCRSGNRSEQAMPIFSDLGFSQVTELEGGIVAWRGSGLPVAEVGS